MCVCVCVCVYVCVCVCACVSVGYHIRNCELYSYILRMMTTDRVTSLDQLEQGQSYVCASNSTYQDVRYPRVPQMGWHGG